MMRITTENGTILTLEQIQKAIMDITDSEELKLFGRPMPSLLDPQHPIRLAKDLPGNDAYEEWAKTQFEKVAPSNAKYVNSWTVMGHDVLVFRDEQGLAAVRIPHAHWKMNSLLKGSALRYGAVTAKAEIKALVSLQRYISETQFDTYILNGMFVETSERSGLKYFFRKSAPTIAMRMNADGEGGRCLACLCLHPLGYYDDTATGCMTPTDEVIAHLLMMRADEHFFWRKANQHKNWDPRSGI